MTPRVNYSRAEAIALDPIYVPDVRTQKPKLRVVESVDEQAAQYEAPLGSVSLVDLLKKHRAFELNIKMAVVKDDPDCLLSYELSKNEAMVLDLFRNLNENAWLPLETIHGQLKKLKGIDDMLKNLEYGLLKRKYDEETKEVIGYSQGIAYSVSSVVGCWHWPIHQVLNIFNGKPEYREFKGQNI